MAKTWSDIGRQIGDTGKDGWETLKTLGDSAKTLVMGSGKNARGAVGGVAGFGNGILKGLVSAGDSIAQGSLSLLRKNPRTAVILGVIAAGLGAADWVKGHKARSAEQAELNALREQDNKNEVLKAARAQTSSDMGETNPNGRADGNSWANTPQVAGSQVNGPKHNAQMAH